MPNENINSLNKKEHTQVHKQIAHEHNKQAIQLDEGHLIY